MFYKLTMKDNRILFLPLREVHEKIKIGLAKVSTFQTRLNTLQVHYPDCIDWEMVEPEEVPSDPNFDDGDCSPAGPIG